MRALGNRFYWISILCTLGYWPLLYCLIEDFRDTPLSIFASPIHAYAYQLSILLGWAIPLAMLAFGIYRAPNQKWALAAIALLPMAYSVAGALFNTWIVGCYGFGEGCI